MNKTWISALSIAVAVIAILFGILERSYAQALVKQVDRHELILVDNTRAVSEARVEIAKLIIEFRELKKAIEEHTNKTK